MKEKGNAGYEASTCFMLRQEVSVHNTGPDSTLAAGTLMC
jgi:hypothetical protein